MIGFRGEDFKTYDIDYMMETSHVAIILTGQRLAILQWLGNYGVLMSVKGRLDKHYRALQILCI